MILTGQQIKQEIGKGRIYIHPYREECIQPNNYDFHLGNEIIRYFSGVINDSDVKFEKIVISESGLLLQPGELYLGITEEITASDHFTQLLYGDKSIGSLGIWVQVSAPLAHVGSQIRWTLEIRCIKKVIIYPGMKFGKICFIKNSGKILPYGDKYFWNSGRYNENSVTPSLLDQDVPVFKK